MKNTKKEKVTQTGSLESNHKERFRTHTGTSVYSTEFWKHVHAVSWFKALQRTNHASAAS